MKQFIFFATLICSIEISSFAASHIVSLCAQSDFTDGKLQSVKIDADGLITLANALKSVASFPEESSIWSLAADAGGTLFAGTGNEGRIYRMDPGKEPVLVFDSPEVAILCLVCGPKGSVFAGTAPGGLIYEISPKSPPAVFARTGEHYVWDLVLDSKGTITAATGDKAKIVQFDKTGNQITSHPFEVNHVRSLATCGTDILAGTADPAAVYRLTGDDLQVLYDAKEREINRIITLSNGNIFFSAISSSAIRGLEIKPGMALEPGLPANGNKEVSTLYRIASDGIVEPWWRTSAVPIFDIAQVDGHPWVACGTKGFLFEVTGPDQASLVSSLSDLPVLTILPDTSGLILGTSTTASIMKLTRKLNEEGTYESETYDGETLCNWGTLDYTALHEADGSITIETRSGNREHPDELWSDWTNLKQDGSVSRIQSPPARYLQWRVTLNRKPNSASPSLECVVFSVSKPNRSPRIRALQIYPAKKGVFVEQAIASGKVYRQEFSDGTRLEYLVRPQNGVAGIDKGQWFKLRGMRTIRWVAQDPDRDRLDFEVAISPFGMQQWTVLESEYSLPIYSFDSTAFPDGQYEVRITATDGLSKPKGQALSTTKLSKAFIIDNTAPSIQVKTTSPEDKPGTVHIIGWVTDNLDRITQLEYSFNAEKWYPFICKDGIIDSREERIDLVIPLETHPVKIFLRVTDAHENVTTTAFAVNE
jgi:hypothetical protein